MLPDIIKTPKLLDIICGLGKLFPATDVGIAPLLKSFVHADGNLMVPLAGKRLWDVHVCSKHPPVVRGFAICYCWRVSVDLC